MKPVHILGISAYYHDSAACLLRDGILVAAAQEERFSRKKHDPGYPGGAIAYCLRQGGISIGDVDYVAFYDKPFLKFERILETYLSYAPRGFGPFIKAMPLWIKDKLWTKENLRNRLKYKGPMTFPEHHQSHAASAFFASPFQEAAFVTLDGVGEWATTSFGSGEGNRIQIKQEIHFPHSLGLLYSAFTYYIGFKVNSGEYKVMGLAPYGRPRFADLIYKHLLDVKPDGSFWLDMRYFNYCAGLTMTNSRFHALFGGPPRRLESRITQREMDLARSVQDVTEEVMLGVARQAQRETGAEHLCLAGGVALNCVGNGRIVREGPFKKIWIQPAAGDAGGALGAALMTWHHYLDKPRMAGGRRDFQAGSYLGPSYTDEEIAVFLKNGKIPYERTGESDLPSRVADLISCGNVVGWFQGRMEYGPRALGSRSILGDARNPNMQEIMNVKIKFRESFRPFAPAVLRERVSEYFEFDDDSPYMLLVAQVAKNHRKSLTPEQEALFGIEKLNVARSDIPAVTHVDYSARVQTVHPDTHPLFHELLRQFEARHGCAVVINTSFNVRGEPIVCTPQEAYRCFMRTNMDYLVLGHCLLEKSKQPALVGDADWQKEFDPD